ncbi:MAG: immunoglobulin domain-containing protein [Verrucomicrobia bacterium]|nr:immunoglobulin domain-containing protein [Verrucomicrobiota bacterium]
MLATLVTAPAQVVAPTIHTVSVDDGDNLRLGSILTLRFTATAGSLPIDRAVFVYANTSAPGGTVTRVLETTTPATGVVTAAVTDDWPAGEYRLTGVTLENALGQPTFTSSTSLPPGSWAFAPPGPSESLFLTRFVVTGTRPYVRPVLTALSRSGSAEVAAGSTVIFRPTVTPGSSALGSVSVTLKDPNGASIFTTSSDVSQVAVTLPAFAISGKYTVEHVLLFDEARTSTLYFRTGQIGTFPGPVVQNVAMAGADFTLTGGVGDPVFPTLTSHTLNSASVKLGDTVSVDYAIVPGNRRVKSVTFYFKGPVGTKAVAAVSDASTGRASLVVPAAWVSGRYALERVELVDVGDYTATYEASGRLILYAPVGLKSPGSHDFNLAARAFTLADGIAPLPVIVTQPQDATPEPGATVQFRISAVSPAGFDFEWYEGVAGDTRKQVSRGGSAFSARATTNTSYWVRVFNSYGSVNSRTATVTPRFASAVPTFLSQPQSVTVGAGNGVDVRANVTGLGPMTFQWFQNGEPVPGATTAVLQAAAQPATAGTYYLVVTNAGGSVRSKSVEVVITEKPRILAQSLSQSVKVGDRVTFDVTATGGDLRQDWGKDGAALTGVSGSTYMIESVQPRDAGRYSYHAGNLSGSVDGTPIVLSVIDRDPPVFAPLDSDLYVMVGQRTGFSVYADTKAIAIGGTPPPGCSWSAEGSLFSGAPTQAGTYTVTFTASNAAGSTSRTVTIRVLVQPFAPIFITHPKSQQAYVDQPVLLSGKAMGAELNGDYVTYQWRRDGVLLPFAKSPFLELPAVRLGDAGTYILEARTNYGTTASQPAILTVLPPIAPPAISAQPQSRTLAPGADLTLSVTATSAAPATYQWYRNGVAVAGATAASLMLTKVEAPQTGSYTVEVGNPAGKTTSQAATVALDEVVPGHLTNLSVRSLSSPGDRTLIAGFSVKGTRSKPMLLRVVGPQLRLFGLEEFLGDPKLKLVKDGATVAVNDNWSSTNNRIPLTEVTKRLGAFALTDYSADAAITLPLDAGTYNLVGGTTFPASGTVLIELYDAEDSFGRVTSRLTNVSARSQVGIGAEVLITGLVVAGQTPCRLLVRGIGPGLAAFGLGGTLAAPRLQVFRGSTLVAENTNWATQAAEMTNAGQSVGAFALRAADRDTGMVTSLPPGAYTVVLSGTGDTTGIGLIELYALP